MKVTGAICGPNRFQAGVQWGPGDLVLFSSSTSVVLWDTATDAITPFFYHTSPVRQAVWVRHDDGHPMNMFVSADEAGTVALWSPSDALPLATWSLPHPGPMRVVAVQEGSAQTAVRVFSAHTGGQLVASTPAPDSAHSIIPAARPLALTWAAGRLLVGAMDGKTRVYTPDMTPGVEVGSTVGWVNDAAALALPDGSTLLAMTQDESVILWKIVKNGPPVILQVISDPAAQAGSVALTRDTLAIGCGDGAILIYNIGEDCQAVLDTNLAPFGVACFTAIIGVALGSGRVVGQTVDGALHRADRVGRDGQWQWRPAPAGPSATPRSMASVAPGLVVVAGDDRIARVFTTSPLVEIARPIIHGYPVCGVRYVHGCLLVWAAEACVRILRPTTSFDRTVQLMAPTSGYRDTGTGIGAIQPPMRLLNKPMFTHESVSLFERALMMDQPQTEVSEFRPVIIGQRSGRDESSGIPIEPPLESVMERTLWGQAGEVGVHGPVRYADAASDGDVIMVAIAPEASRPSDATVQVMRVDPGTCRRDAGVTISTGQAVTSVGVVPGFIAVGTAGAVTVYDEAGVEVRRVALEEECTAVRLLPTSGDAAGTLAVLTPVRCIIAPLPAGPTLTLLGGTALALSREEAAIGDGAGWVSVYRIDGSTTEAPEKVRVASQAVVALAEDGETRLVCVGADGLVSRVEK